MGLVKKKLLQSQILKILKDILTPRCFPAELPEPSLASGPPLSSRWCQYVTSVTRQLSLGLPGPPSPPLRSSSTSESSALHSSPLQHIFWPTSSATGDWRDSNPSS